MQKVDELVLDKTIVLINKGQFKEASISLMPLLKKHPKSSLVCFVAAKFYYESGKYYSSSKYFKRLLLIKPDSEIASLGLFHSYFELGKIILGLREITRFCKNNKPKLYRTTIKELNDNIDDFSKIQKKMILGLPVLRSMLNK
jgi:predicted Zn-dependent protease